MKKLLILTSQSLKFLIQQMQFFLNLGFFTAIRYTERTYLYTNKEATQSFRFGSASLFITSPFQIALVY